MESFLLHFHRAFLQTVGFFKTSGDHIKSFGFSHFNRFGSFWCFNRFWRRRCRLNCFRGDNFRLSRRRNRNQSSFLTDCRFGGFGNQSFLRQSRQHIHARKCHNKSGRNRSKSTPAQTGLFRLLFDSFLFPVGIIKRMQRNYRNFPFDHNPGFGVHRFGDKRLQSKGFRRKDAVLRSEKVNVSFHIQCQRTEITHIKTVLLLKTMPGILNEFSNYFFGMRHFQVLMTGYEGSQ